MWTLLLSRHTDPPGTFIDRRQIDSGEIRIGRDVARCDWVLADSSGHISRAHCTVSVVGLDLYVVDTSTNGISLNRPGQRIAPQQPVAVRVSDRLLLGDYVIEVTTEAAGLAANLQAQVAAANPPAAAASGFGQPDSWFDGGVDPMWGTGAPSAEVHEFLGSAMHDFLAPPKAASMGGGPGTGMGGGMGGADPWGGPLSDAFSRPILASAPAVAPVDFAIPEDWAAPASASAPRGNDPFAGADPFAASPAPYSPPPPPPPAGRYGFGGDPFAERSSPDPFAGMGDIGPGFGQAVDAAADPFAGFDPAADPFAGFDAPVARDAGSGSPPPARQPDPFALPTDGAADPFATPDPAPRRSVPTDDPFALPAPAPSASDPFAMPAPARETPTPPPQAVSPQSAAPDGEGWAAFCAGAGIDPADLRTSPDAMHRLGVLYKQVVLGLSDLIQDRAAFKDEFRVERTQLGLGRNNPLKHLPALDSAKLLLGEPLPGFMGAEESVRSAFEDVKKHQLAMLAGVQHALRAVFERLSPDEIQRVMAKAAGDRRGLRIGRGVNPWTVYQAVFDALRKDATSNVNSIMSVAFREGYEAFLNGRA